MTFSHPERLPDLSQLEGEVRGYCVDKDDELFLRAAGLSHKQIYCEGRGAETIAACIVSFRGRPGTLIVAAVLPRPFKRDGIFVVGFTASLREQITEIIDALLEAPALRRLCAIL